MIPAWMIGAIQGRLVGGEVVSGIMSVSGNVFGCLVGGEWDSECEW